MAETVNTRELITEILVAVDKKEAPGHILLKGVLDKFNYLETQDKAFIKRVTEGTLERRITIDYYINRVSNTPVNKMKPFIRNLIRMSVYQIFYMDKVPDSAACNEAVKLASKKNFGNLSGFVNGVLRNISRKKDSVTLPDIADDPVVALSVKYSAPEMIVKIFLDQYGTDVTEEILEASLRKRNLYVRIREDASPEQIEAVKDEWHMKGFSFEKSKYLPYAYMLVNAENIGGLEMFRKGLYTVQDVSSMFVGELADIEGNDLIIDVCGAPGGKSLHAAAKIKRAWRESNGAGPLGLVICRDISEYKVSLIKENIERMMHDNIKTYVWDAREFDEQYENKADIVILDIPCSGLGVIGKKPDIKYNATEEGFESLNSLQKEIIDTCVRYVKDGGTLMYSTCTMRREENEEMVRYIKKKHGFTECSFIDKLPEALKRRCISDGQIQLMPQDGMDGFFIARLTKNGH